MKIKKNQITENAAEQVPEEVLTEAVPDKGASDGNALPKKKFRLKKPTKLQVKKFAKHAAYVVLGNAIAAAATAFFIDPNKLVMGGTSGIGIFVRNLLESAGHDPDGAIIYWSVNLTVYIANIILFIIGAIFMGKKYAAATLAGTLLYPTFMMIYKPLNDLYMENNANIPMGGTHPMLATIAGALIFGVGIAIVVRVGASTGGTDIPPMILHKYFNIPVGASMIILDCVIVALQMIAPQVGLDTALYGIIVTILSCVIIDTLSPIGMRRSQVKIISKKYKEIRQMILTKMNRGVTMLYGRSGFLQEKCYVIMTVVSNRDVVKLKDEIYKIDPTAFLMISVISEVRGNGFSTDEKIALPKQQMNEDLIDVTDEFKDEAPPRRENGEEKV